MIISNDAERLAKMFSDESEIPIEYKIRTKNNLIRAAKEKDTKILLRFIEELKRWQTTINTMLEKLPRAKAFRFIHLAPEVGEDITKIVECDDFVGFTEYLILRRDIENCGDDELGRLCRLSMAFQQRIESVISPPNINTPKKTRVLKNARAQSLMEQKIITIDGIELNLWTGHTKETVQSQMTWNKVQSYTELNNNTSGENGSIVVTGTWQIPVREVLDYAIKMGFKVHSCLSKKTDFLVVGSSTVSPTKIAEMQEFNESGANIKLVDENAFLTMLAEYVE